MYEELFADYRQLVDISKTEWDKVIAGMYVKNLSRGTTFIAPGDPSNVFALVISGVGRHYYVDNDGKEWTKSFAGPGNLLGAYAELLQGHPSRTFVEAITDITMLQGGKRELELMQASVWDKFWRKLAEEHFIKKENREYEFLKYDAAARYQAYLGTYAHLDSQIPKKHVASYLGITPQALSRLINS